MIKFILALAITAVLAVTANAQSYQFGFTGPNGGQFSFGQFNGRSNFQFYPNLYVRPQYQYIVPAPYPRPLYYVQPQPFYGYAYPRQYNHCPDRNYNNRGNDNRNRGNDGHNRNRRD